MKAEKLCMVLASVGIALGAHAGKSEQERYEHER